MYSTLLHLRVVVRRAVLDGVGRYIPNKHFTQGARGVAILEFLSVGQLVEIG